MDYELEARVEIILKIIKMGSSKAFASGNSENLDLWIHLENEFTLLLKVIRG